jgi:hypothetical protein
MEKAKKNRVYPRNLSSRFLQKMLSTVAFILVFFLKKYFTSLIIINLLKANRLKYNPINADLHLLYPTKNPDESTIYEDNRIQRRDFSTANLSFESDKVVLDELLPTIIPDDSYFEPGELKVLDSDDHPLRFPPRYYIS